MKRLSLLVVVTSALLAALSLRAAPAPWYQWQSLATGRYMCSATDPGEGWKRHSGPYNNGACRNN
ncbi:hypothetical protein [Pseudomonas carassii]|uniref:Secreted protein n=1 Tax=Pseudomonas carassii TaxID=3115855 RepID=A0ABU7H4E8_9PSED|nr:hypothetical protein [Pseudomonas sp. 137P]MEE1886194.1 hypothetical protein [Pseudomonas sp. 137P]